ICSISRIGLSMTKARLLPCLISIFCIVIYSARWLHKVYTAGRHWAIAGPGVDSFWGPWKTPNAVLRQRQHQLAAVVPGDLDLLPVPMVGHRQHDAHRADRNR